jgi:hypothetical protein
VVPNAQAITDEHGGRMANPGDRLRAEHIELRWHEAVAFAPDDRKTTLESRVEDPAHFLVRFPCAERKAIHLVEQHSRMPRVDPPEQRCDKPEKDVVLTCWTNQRPLELRSLLSRHRRIVTCEREARSTGTSQSLAKGDSDPTATRENRPWKEKPTPGLEPSAKSETAGHRPAVPPGLICY